MTSAASAASGALHPSLWRHGLRPRTVAGRDADVNAGSDLRMRHTFLTERAHGSLSAGACRTGHRAAAPSVRRRTDAGWEERVRSRPYGRGLVDVTRRLGRIVELPP